MVDTQWSYLYALFFTILLPNDMNSYLHHSKYDLFCCTSIKYIPFRELQAFMPQHRYLASFQQQQSVHIHLTGQFLKPLALDSFVFLKLSLLQRVCISDLKFVSTFFGNHILVSQNFTVAFIQISTSNCTKTDEQCIEGISPEFFRIFRFIIPSVKKPFVSTFRQLAVPKGLRRRNQHYSCFRSFFDIFRLLRDISPI